MSNQALIKEVIEKEKHAFMTLITEKKAMERIAKISNTSQDIESNMIFSMIFFTVILTTLGGLHEPLMKSLHIESVIVYSLLSLAIIIFPLIITLLSSTKKDKHIMDYFRIDPEQCITQLFEKDFLKETISEETKIALKTSLTMDEYKTLFIKHDVVSYAILQDYLSNLDKHNSQTYALEQDKLSIDQNSIDSSETLKQHIAIPQ